MLFEVILNSVPLFERKPLFRIFSNVHVFIIKDFCFFWSLRPRKPTKRPAPCNIKVMLP